MERRPFLPTARQVNVLLTVGFLSVGYALYMRYLVIEQTTVGLACEAGLATGQCRMRGFIIALFNARAFGLVALGAALVHLWRPSVAALAVGLGAAAFGLVLYNTGLSSFALALLILGFARPQRGEGRAPAPAGSARGPAPANSPSPR